GVFFSLASNSVSRAPLVCKFTTNFHPHAHAQGASFIKRAAEISDLSSGFTFPHPNFVCVIATSAGNVVCDGSLYAQAAEPAEVQAVEAAGGFSQGGTAYLNMEPGDCHGDHTAISALVQVFLFLFPISIF